MERKRPCPFIVPVIKGRLPNYPICRETGLSIKATENTPSGLQKSKNCPLGRLTTKYCELKVNKELFLKRIEKLKLSLP